MTSYFDTAHEEVRLGQGFHQRLLDHADWKTLIVKGADRLDNLRSLALAKPEFKQKQVKETRELYYPLMAFLTERTPTAFQDKARQLQHLLLTETEAIANGAVSGER